MYAIIKDGSKQFRVAKGDHIEFDYKKTVKAGTSIEFNEVLLLHDGSKANIGRPTVEGAKVVGEVVDTVPGPKVRVFKYIRREGTQRAQGHKQKYTLVKITDIQSK